jgi:YegS/Rv2252/BmrU family lipid kinase
MTGQRFLLVVNPHGGKRRGLAVLEQVQPVFTAAGAELEVRVTERSGHAQEIARSTNLDGYAGLCLIGGDGTVHEVVNGLLQREMPPVVPLGIIPAGTGNTVHQHLHGQVGPQEAALQILTGSIDSLDVVRVTLASQVLFCMNIIGWGAVVDINRTAEKLRRFGPPRYATAALWHIFRARRRRARLILDGQVHDDDFLFLIACNTKFTGANMKVAPRAEMDDGLLDIVMVRRASRLQMLKLFTRVLDGSHVSLPYVEYHQVRSFTLESAGLEMLNLDGEMKGNTPVTAEVLPAALRVLGASRSRC